MASLPLILFTFLHIAIHVHSSCQVTTDTLCVNQVIDEGFGNITNRYAWAIQTFKGAVYVATLNIINVPAGLIEFTRGKEFATNGGQIYKSIVNANNTWNWEQIVNDGLHSNENCGVRKFAVAGEWMYAVTGNYKNGFEIWRTKDDTFEIVMHGGFGNVNNTSGRGLSVFNNYLYVGCENRESGAKMWRRQLNSNGDFVTGSEWKIISDDGFGDKNNVWFSDIVAFNDYLYVGTLNEESGMQLWRSGDGKLFTNVFKNGNGAEHNLAVMKLYVYNDRLYIGTMNFFWGVFIDE